MAYTDRDFDDHKILKTLEQKHGLIIPGTARDLDIKIEYGAPVMNGTRRAEVLVSFEIPIDAAEADEMLREQL